MHLEIYRIKLEEPVWGHIENNAIEQLNLPRWLDILEEVAYTLLLSDRHEEMNSWHQTGEARTKQQLWREWYEH